MKKEDHGNPERQQYINNVDKIAIIPAELNYIIHFIKMVAELRNKHEKGSQLHDDNLFVLMSIVVRNLRQIETSINSTIDIIRCYKLTDLYNHLKEVINFASFMEEDYKKLDISPYEQFKNLEKLEKMINEVYIELKLIIDFIDN